MPPGAPATPATAILDAAREATAAGLAIVPVRSGSKAPAIPWRGRGLATDDELAGWFDGPAPRFSAFAVVCGAASGGVELVEFESGAMRADLFRRLAERAVELGLGELLDRVVTGYAERSPSGGLHLLWRCPAVGANRVLARDRAGRVLVETRGEGGIVVVAPSRLDAERGWELVAGGFLSITTVTPEEREALLALAASFDESPPRFEPSPLPAGGPLDGNRPGDTFNADPAAPARVLRLLEARGWAAVGARGEVTYLRRPGKSEGLSATLGYAGPGVLHVFSTNASPFEGGRAYSPFAVYALLEHDGDFAAAARALADEGFGERRERLDDWLRGLVGEERAPAQREEPGADGAWPAWVLPAEFWDARPALAHVRAAAFSRLLSPDALLGALLARVAACTDRRLVFPPIVGRKAAPNLIVALPGPPGAGKGSACDAAAELYRPPASFDLEEAPIGSGEGLVKRFFRQEGAGGSKRWVRYVDNLLVRLDEGSLVERFGARQGSTTIEVLRQAWSGETLGFAYSDPDRDRQVAALSYRLSVVVGIQPALAGPILRDRGGLAERISWFSAVHPGVPDPDRLPAWPGPLRVPDPAGGEGDEIDVAAEVVAEIRRAHHSRVVGDGAGPAHAELRRLKVAFALAVLEGRVNVTTDDWGLAGVVERTSAAVVERVRAELAASAAQEDRARGERRARQEEVAEERAAERHARRVERVAAVIARKVQRAGRCTRREVMRGVEGRDRSAADDALALAVDKGWIEPDENGFVPGPHADELDRKG